VAVKRERGTTFLKEFYDFAAKSEAVDLATGATSGAAYSTSALSNVDDGFTPSGCIVIGIDRSDPFVFSSNRTAATVPSLTEAKGAGVAALNNSVIINAMV
jgi:large-conductance mechanosensitive channel